MSTVASLPMDHIIKRASIALGKVDLWGRRGVTMLSVDETEAMALLLASFGLAPTKPGEAPPVDFFFPPLKDR
jgi:hypothetical protein